MANFDAKVQVDVVTGGAERALRKIERNVDRIEDKSREILSVDKQLLRQRKALVGLSGEQAKKAQNSIKLLGLQRRELQLQKTELTQINRLEKQRQANISRTATGGGQSGGGGINPLAVAGAGAAAAASMTPKQIFKQGSLVGELKLDRARVADALDATVEEIEQRTIAVREAYARYRGVVARNSGANQRATTSRKLGVQPKIDALRDSKAAALFGQGRLRDIDTTIESIESAQTKLNDAASRGNGVMGGLAKSLLLTAGAYISVETAARQASAAVQKSIASASSEQRIRALADGFDDYQAVLFQASAAAEKFNISQIDANNQFAQLYGRLRPLGLTLNEINTVFEGFNTAAALTGATAAESAGALLQLSQALGAGALRGEEFNSIAEQAPAVLQAIAKEIDAPVGQLKGLAKEGKITSDVLVAALARVKRDGADKLAAALDTPAQKVQKLANRFEDLQVALGELTLPTVIGLIEELTRVVTTGAEKVDLYTRALDKLLKPLGGLKIDVPLLTEAFSKLPGEIIKSIPGLGQIIRALETIDFLAQRIAGPKPETPKPPTIEDPTTPLAERLGLGGGSGAGGGGGGSAEDTLKRQLETGQDLSREFSRQLQLLQATEGLERELLQIEFDREDRMRSIAEAAAEFRTELTAASDAIAQSQRQNAAQDAFTNFFQADQAVMEGLKDAQEEFNQFFRDNVPTDQLEEALKQSGQRVAAALTDSIGVAIEGLVTGAKDLNDQLQAIASSLLRDVGRIFLNAGINAAAGPGGLFGPQGLPGFADGGTIAPRSLAVVGERGPELVATGPQPVTVISNQESRQMVQQASALDRYSPNNSIPPANYSPQFQTVQFGGQEYVTKEQMNSAMQEGMRIAARDGAKRGEAMTLKRLKNSRSTRSTLGM